jgi:hypothetical protein
MGLASLPLMIGPSDTSSDGERVVIDGYRRMSPAEKLERVAPLVLWTRSSRFAMRSIGDRPST